MSASHGSFFSRNVLGIDRISSGPAERAVRLHVAERPLRRQLGQAVMRAYSRISTGGSRDATTKTSTGAPGRRPE